MIHMSYQSYATKLDYYDLIGGTIPAEELCRRLRTASRHIDSLTYNRIVGQGFSNLTEFQQEIIREVCCRQAEFEYENADMINIVLSSYSINGVSMQMDHSWNVFTGKGVVMKRDTYELLSQTGLCCLGLG